jgi:hypothetical protein
LGKKIYEHEYYVEKDKIEESGHWKIETGSLMEMIEAIDRDNHSCILYFCEFPVIFDGLVTLEVDVCDYDDFESQI